MSKHRCKWIFGLIGAVAGSIIGYAVSSLGGFSIWPIVMAFALGTTMVNVGRVMDDRRNRDDDPF